MRGAFILWLRNYLNRSKPVNVAAAFTLIELMVVIALIGILSAAILPEMKGTYEDALLRSTGRELVNVFQLAYSRAVTLNQVQRVRIDESTGRYLLEAPAREPGVNGAFVPVKDVPGSEGTLDSRIAVSLHLGNAEPASEENSVAVPPPSIESEAASEPNAISFYPDGTADACEIQLQDREGFRLALQINPVTARVRIRELTRK